MGEDEYIAAARERERKSSDLLVSLPNLIMSAMMAFCPLCPVDHEHGTVPHEAQPMKADYI